MKPTPAVFFLSRFRSDQRLPNRKSFMPILEIQQISKTYRVGDRPIRVLDDVSLSVPSGEFLVIQGSSGSGKTTLLSILSGLDRPDTGSVRVGDAELTEMDEEALAPLRNRRFGFVFQSFHLVPSLSALENVAFPAELNGDRDAVERAGRLLARVGVNGRSENFPHQLSGGEKQRVALCRALINDPAILFADEPTGNLDSENSAAILALLAEIRREREITLVLVTHSPEVAAAADRVVTLRDGRVVSEERRAA
jgi:putative ABC transport system ATP-binding protein